MALSISVVIIAHNEAHHITPTLRRLVPLLGPEDELLVVDGESDDGTPALASRYARCIDGPRGRSSLLNLGAALARSDVLLFLHADSRLPIQGLERIREYMSSSPKPLGGYFRPHLLPERSLLSSLVFPLVSTLLELRSRLFQIGTGEQALFVSRNAFENLAGFQSLPLLEDLDFVSRLKSEGGLVEMLSARVGIRGRHWERRGLFSTLRQRLLFLLTWRFASSREDIVERLRDLRRAHSRTNHGNEASPREGYRFPTVSPH